jgi:hypothetical protein
MILTLDLKNVQNKSIPLPFAACLVACLKKKALESREKPRCDSFFFFCFFCFFFFCFMLLRLQPIVECRVSRLVVSSAENIESKDLTTTTDHHPKNKVRDNRKRSSSSNNSKAASSS